MMIVIVLTILTILTIMFTTITITITTIVAVVRIIAVITASAVFEHMTIVSIPLYVFELRKSAANPSAAPWIPRH